MRHKATLFDIAGALGISTGTVHRALHNHPGVSSATRSRVLQVSRSLGYRPNLAARFLSQRKNFRISVNTLIGTILTGTKSVEVSPMPPARLAWRTSDSISALRRS